MALSARGRAFTELRDAVRSCDHFAHANCSAHLTRVEVSANAPFQRHVHRPPSHPIQFQNGPDC